MGVPDRDRSAGGVEVEGRALAKINVGVRTQSRSHAGKSQGAGVDVDAAGEGVGAGDDEDTRARLGERTRATRDQVIDGQRVSRSRAFGRDDDFRVGSAEGTRAGDGGGTGAIIKEHTARGVSEESVERKGLGTSQFERIHALGAGDRQVGGGEIVGGGGQSRGRERCIRRESARGRTADEPVDAAEGGPTANDAIGAGRTGREGEAATGDRGEVERGARRAGTQGSKGEYGGAAGDTNGLNGTMAGRGGKGTEGLGGRRTGDTFITEHTTRGVAEGVDVEDDRAAVRQDVERADFAELEHAVGNGGGAGQGIVRGRGDHPGSRAHLLQAGDDGAAIRDDRSDDVVGRVRAAEAEGLRRRTGSDRTGDRQRTSAVGDEHRGGIRARSVEIDGSRKGGGRASIDQGAGTIVVRVIAAEADFRHSTEGAHTGDLHGALQDIENSPQVTRRPLKGEVTNAFLMEGVSRRGGGLLDAASDEGVAVTVNAQGAGGGVALTPKVGVERQQTVTFIADTGFVSATAADEVIEAGERGAETVTAVKDDARVATVGVEVAELEDTPDGGAGQTVVDEDPAVGVITDVDILLGEAVEDVAANFERAVVDVDRQATGVQAERTGGGDADSTAVDTDTRSEGVLVVLQPERRAVDQPGLDDAVLRVVVVVDLTGDDEVTVAVKDHRAAGAEVHVTRKGGDARHGGEAGFLNAATKANSSGEGVVADGDERAGAVDGARTTTARADHAIEDDAIDGVRSLHDERTTAESRVARAGHAGDGNGANTRAQLGCVGDDQCATLDENTTVQRVGIIGQHQRAVTRLRETRSTVELRRNRHARTEVNAQGRHRLGGRLSEGQFIRAADLVIVTRGERDAGED